MKISSPRQPRPRWSWCCPGPGSRGCCNRNQSHRCTGHTGSHPTCCLKSLLLLGTNDNNNNNNYYYSNNDNYINHSINNNINNKLYQQ